MSQLDWPLVNKRFHGINSIERVSAGSKLVDRPPSRPGVCHASRIIGTTMPVLEFALDPNESVISEAGELSWITSSIQMTTHTPQLGGGGSRT